MGDINKTTATNKPSTKSNPEQEQDAAGNAEKPSDGRPSFELLKETKELADITSIESSATNKKSDDVQGAEGVQKSESIDLNEQRKTAKSMANIETVFEKNNLDLTAASESPLKTDAPQELSNTNADSGNTGKMNKLRDHSSTIFPAGIMGCKIDDGNAVTSPRRFLDAQEANKDNIGHIDAIPRKMGISKSDQIRNPLTGTGIDCIDEIKRTASKKKLGGNPVLGVGYVENKQSTSSTRIPPGGFSHGLW